MQPTDSENTGVPEEPKAFAAAWANVSLDLSEKQTQLTPSPEADSNSNAREQRCKSTSKPTPK
jgi:hypothetical protein